MNPEPESIQSQGGKARASKLTPAELADASSKAAKARWELPKATHSGVLNIGDMTFPCSVLSDGSRILTQTDFMEGMGLYYSGWVANNRPEGQSADTPHFLAFKSLEPFIAKHLGSLQSITVKYRTEKGKPAHGIKADIIPRICEIWMDADEHNALVGRRQKLVVAKAKIMMRALAHTGIVALVDEVTGYQDIRAKDALAVILEKFIAKELQAWTSTFPLDFYKEIFRLNKWDHLDPTSGNRPSCIGRWTNDIVYDRLAPNVLEELKAKNPKVDGRRKHKHFQWLSGDVGHPRLLAHLEGVKMLMKVSATWEEFKNRVNQFYPKLQVSELGFEVESTPKPKNLTFPPTSSETSA